MTAKGKPITSFESNDTNCRTFMKCDDTGVGVAYCCRSHYRYNKDTMSCEKIFDLDDPCLEAHCPHGFAEGITFNILLCCIQIIARNSFRNTFIYGMFME